jgi:rhamnose transport system permease protein
VKGNDELNLIKRREFTLFILIIIQVMLITLRAPRFLSLSNFNDILDDTAILFMVATGQLMVILIAGIDLSVASGLALTGMSVALLNQYHPGVPMLVIFLMSIAIGFLLGSFNGVLVAYGNIPAIITTLGTLSIYRGLVFVLSKGSWVSAHEMTDTFRSFTRIKIFGLSLILIISFMVILLFTIFLHYSRTGREIYGVGGNITAAQYVGINLKKIKYQVFALCGALYGLSGFLWVARYASAQNDTAIGFELQTVAACVIGGASIAGGSGSILGVVLGALFLGIIKNALPVINVSPFWQMLIQGFIILVAIIINTVMSQRSQQFIIKR